MSDSDSSIISELRVWSKMIQVLSIFRAIYGSVQSTRQCVLGHDTETQTAPDAVICDG